MIIFIRKKNFESFIELSLRNTKADILIETKKQSEEMVKALKNLSENIGKLQETWFAYLNKNEELLKTQNQMQTELIGALNDILIKVDKTVCSLKNPVFEMKQEMTKLKTAIKENKF